MTLLKDKAFFTLYKEINRKWMFSWNWFLDIHFVGKYSGELSFKISLNFSFVFFSSFKFHFLQNMRELTSTILSKIREIAIISSRKCSLLISLFYYVYKLKNSSHRAHFFLQGICYIYLFHFLDFVVRLCIGAFKHAY